MNFGGIKLNKTNLYKIGLSKRFENEASMYDENLSEEAQKELDEFVNYLKFKYKNK